MLQQQQQQQRQQHQQQRALEQQRQQQHQQQQQQQQRQQQRALELQPVAPLLQQRALELQPIAPLQQQRAPQRQQRTPELQQQRVLQLQLLAPKPQQQPAAPRAPSWQALALPIGAHAPLPPPRAAPAASRMAEGCAPCGSSSGPAAADLVASPGTVVRPLLPQALRVRGGVASHVSVSLPKGSRTPRLPLTCISPACPSIVRSRICTRCVISWQRTVASTATPEAASSGATELREMMPEVARDAAAAAAAAAASTAAPPAWPLAATAAANASAAPPSTASRRSTATDTCVG